MAILVPQSALDKLAAEHRKREGILDEMPKDGFTLRDLQKALNIQHAHASKVVTRYGTYAGKLRDQTGHWCNIYIPKKGKP